MNMGNDTIFFHQVSFSLDMHRVLDREKSEEVRKVMYKIHRNYMIAKYGKYRKNIFSIQKSLQRLQYKRIIYTGKRKRREHLQGLRLASAFFLAAIYFLVYQICYILYLSYNNTYTYYRTNIIILYITVCTTIFTLYTIYEQVMNIFKHSLLIQTYKKLIQTRYKQALAQPSQHKPSQASTIIQRTFTISTYQYVHIYVHLYTPTPTRACSMCFAHVAMHKQHKENI